MTPTLPISLALAVLFYCSSASAFCCIMVSGRGCDSVSDVADWTPRGFVERGTGALTTRKADLCCCSAGTAAMCKEFC